MLNKLFSFRLEYGCTSLNTHEKRFDTIAHISFLSQKISVHYILWIELIETVKGVLDWTSNCNIEILVNKKPVRCTNIEAVQGEEVGLLVVT